MLTSSKYKKHPPQSDVLKIELLLQLSAMNKGVIENMFVLASFDTSQHLLEVFAILYYFVVKLLFVFLLEFFDTP